jgi:murein DD-endopeptidase MepM/ murein hydrolase activator NlpD
MYYTHVDLAPSIAQDATVSRGQVLGNLVAVAGTPPHLHFALAERSGGENVGVDVVALLLRTADTPTITTLAFFQDGRPPQEAGSSTPVPAPPTPVPSP